MSMITVHVKQKHIKRGVYGSCSRCPIALAVKERIGRRNVWAAPRCIQIGEKTFVTPPKSVDTFIKRFDNYLKVNPFSFKLKYDKTK